MRAVAIRIKHLGNPTDDAGGEQLKDLECSAECLSRMYLFGRFWNRNSSKPVIISPAFADREVSLSAIGVIL